MYLCNPLTAAVEFFKGAKPYEVRSTVRDKALIPSKTALRILGREDWLETDNGVWIRGLGTRSLILTSVRCGAEGSRVSEAKLSGRTLSNEEINMLSVNLEGLAV